MKPATAFGRSHYASLKILATACAMVSTLGSLYAQRASEKLIAVRDPAQITDAVMISGVAVAGKPVECGLFIKPPVVIQPFTPFQAGPDWLNEMTISLINRTGRTISFGSMIMHFLDTGDCHALPCVEFEPHFGRIPEVDAYNARSGRPLSPQPAERLPLNWRPGQTIVIHVGDYMDEIKDSLANFMATTAVNKINVYRGGFYFDDGMLWSLGRYSVPDPEHHGKFKQLPADYFPGRWGNNWPPGYDQ